VEEIASRNCGGKTANLQRGKINRLAVLLELSGNNGLGSPARDPPRKRDGEEARRVAVAEGGGEKKCLQHFLGEKSRRRRVCSGKVQRDYLAKERKRR